MPLDQANRIAKPRLCSHCGRPSFSDVWAMTRCPRFLPFGGRCPGYYLVDNAASDEERR